MTPEQRRAILQRFREQNPRPVTELIYQSPFELLIAVILSAQATDKSVNLATKNLFAAANTPEAFLKLGIDRLKQFIRTIGLYNTKAENILKTCRILVDQHQSKVPPDRKALEALPGVGRKTANVILNTLFDQATIAVDTHVFRVANRTGLAPGKTPEAVEKKLMETIPTDYLKDAHHWLVLHGRYVCTARKPHCPTCLIKDLCEYPEKTTE